MVQRCGNINKYIMYIYIYIVFLREVFILRLACSSWRREQSLERQKKSEREGEREREVRVSE